MSEHEALRVPAARLAMCEVCGDTLDVEAFGVCQYTEGWVLHRSGGGGHGISDRKVHNRWAHSGCVERRALARRDQGTLFS